MRGIHNNLHTPKIKLVLLALAFLIFTPITGQIIEEESTEERIRKVRIVGGTFATHENTKHQASIRKRDVDNHLYGMGHGCSGSLISSSVVLSVAHCYVDLDPFDLIVVMGNLDRYDKTNTLSFDLGDWVWHPEFNNTTTQNDIALLFLAGSVNVDNENIRPIEINRQPVTEITMCQVTGWGATERSTNSPSRLLAVDIAAIPYAICKNMTILEEHIQPGMLCAGDIFDWGKGSSYGDSGGPLVCHALLVGLVSHGLSNKYVPSGLPGIYTAVDYYQDWIDTEMRKPRQLRKRSGSKKVSFSLLLVIGSIFGGWI